MSLFRYSGKLARKSNLYNYFMSFTINFCLQILKTAACSNRLSSWGPEILICNRDIKIESKMDVFKEYLSVVIRVKLFEVWGGRRRRGRALVVYVEAIAELPAQNWLWSAFGPKLNIYLAVDFSRVFMCISKGKFIRGLAVSRSLTHNFTVCGYCLAILQK